MQQPPLIFDRKALVRNRKRASQSPVTFLRAAVADEIEERLNEVKRTFTAPAIVTGWPGIWAGRLPDATIIPDDDVLKLGPMQHDLVIHDLSLHWANDPVGQLVQCRHALKPDGLLLATLFGGRTLTELRSSLAKAEVQVSGGLSPRVAPMGEIRDLGGLLQRAGFSLPVADALPFHVTYADALDLMRDLRGMGEGNALAGRLRRPTRPTMMALVTQIYAEGFGNLDGRIPASYEVIVLTGWAPAPTQPRPLRPGSATHRLADILRAPETPLTPRDD